MILVADSGSTNTDWVVIEKKNIISTFTTRGFNPYFTKSEEIYHELSIKFPKDIKIDEIRTIFFYGSGCSAPEMKLIIHDGLKQFFPLSLIEIEHDLLGAARSLFLNESGIALILGTGASTCLYDGYTIIKNIPSLGYVLGDEGGGDYLGKLFVTELLYGKIPEIIQNNFLEKYRLTNNKILFKIYKEPNPNRFLASFCDFISENSNDSSIEKIIKKSFTDLFINHITKYENFQNYKIRVTGSVGFYFQKQLKEVATEYKTQIDLVERNPIMRLAQYHTYNK